MNKFPRNIIIMAVVVALLSAAYSFYYHDRPRVDAKAYNNIGWNLASGYGYVELPENFDTPELDDAPARVGPGYQFFLAGVYTIFGHNIWVVWILQAVLRGAGVILIYLISKLLFPDLRKIHFLSSLLFGLSPDLIVVSGLLLTETFFIFLLMTAVYLTLKLFKENDPSKEKIFVLGLMWALAILTRPVALLPAALIFLIFMWRRELLKVFVFLIPIFMIIAPWSYYMTTRYDHFILTTSIGGYDLWVGNNPEAEGGFVKTKKIQEFRNNNHSVVADKVGKEKYFEFMFGEPFKFVELQIRKTALYFSLIRPASFWMHLSPHPYHRLFTAISSAFWTAILFIFGIAGAIKLLKENKDIQSRIFVAFATLQPMAVIPIIVETRYRYPLFLFLSVLAAYYLLNKLKDKKFVVSSVLILVFLTGYDVFSNWSDIIIKINTIIPF